MAVAALLIIFFVTIFTQLPVAIVLGVSSLGSIVLSGDYPLSIIITRMFSGIDSYTLIAIPMFILAGSLLNESGATMKMFDFADALVGRFRGGLGHTNVFASVLFAGLSGSAVADSAGLGRIEIESMTKKGYKPEFSSAITASSAVIGPIIPPSIPMIVYGAMTGESVIRLFAGGIIPGLLTALFLMLMVYIIARKTPNFPVSDHGTLEVIFATFKRAFLPLMAPVIILGGIFSGFYTPTEASVVTVLYVIILDIFVYKTLKLKDYKRILLQTILDSAAVLIIISTASVFGWLLAVEKIPQLLTSWLSVFMANPIIILLLINLILLFLGCFVEGLAVMAILIPVFVPLIIEAGLSPIHFGVLMVYNLMVGTVTPPLGMSLFVISNITKISVGKLTRAMVPFYIPLVVTLLLISFFPQLVMFLPNLL
jgi:tripartite ATP-independent transporter DctM subunit